MEHREAARALAHERVAYWNRFYDFPVGRISIRDQRSRWGSASTNGSLNFNYRIASLPAHLVDYLVVHELCHLGQMNHSPAFWSLVARTVSDYKVRRAELRSLDLSCI
jgi:predicted metal-dependent hydrolase